MTRRILVIDDEPTARRAVEAALGRQGDWGIRSVATLAEADEVAAAWRPHLVILDLELPGSSGELWLAHQGPHRTMDVIVVTGHDDAETALRLLRLGIRDFLVKPVSPQRLRLAAERVFGQPAGDRHPATVTASGDGALAWPATLPTIAACTASLISEALRRCDGNAAAAARLLGISRQAMSKRLRRDG